MARAADFCVSSTQEHAFLLLLLIILPGVRVALASSELCLYSEEEVSEGEELAPLPQKGNKVWEKLAFELEDLGTVIGIDLWTTHLRVGVYEGLRVDIIGNYIMTPSWPAPVAFGHDHSEPFMGEDAKDQAAAVFGVKMLIGRKFDDPEVQRAMKLLPYKVVNKDGKPYINVKVNYNGDDEMKLMSPEEISAMMLKNMKQMAEWNLGKEIKSAVVAVPAYFTDAQRQATKEAGAIAGLDIVRIIEEPIAAIIAYDLHHKTIVGESNTLVFHLGGSTNFDVSMVAGDYDFWAVRSSLTNNGENSTRLGVEVGEDLEQNVINYFVEQALKDSGLNKEDIDDILLVGGSTRSIPKVQQILKDFFDGKEPYNNSESITHGAAIHGAFLGGDYVGEYFDLWLSRPTIPSSYGVETLGGVMTKLIPRNYFYPSRKTKVFTTCHDQQTTVSIKVYKGESTLTEDCYEVGKLELSGIPPAPRGVPQIEMTFEIDGSTVPRVTAMDKATNKSNATAMPRKTELGSEEFSRLFMEWDNMFEFERYVKERNKSRNRFKYYVDAMKKRVEDTAKMPAKNLGYGDREEMETALKEAIEWLDRSPNASKIDIVVKMEELEAVLNPRIRKAYKYSAGRQQLARLHVL